MRARMGALWAGAIAVSIVGFWSTGAGAATPVDLGSSHIVDQSGVVDGKTAPITSAIDKLYSSTGIDLYVVYVDTFTNPTSAESWANATAEKNNLGPTDYLLAIATTGRAYYLSADSSGPLTESQVSDIEQKKIEPALHKSDWAGAAVAAATGIADANGGSGGGWGFFWVIIIAVLVVGGILFFVLRRRRSGAARVPGGAADPLAGLTLPELERRAGSALVQTDDAIKTSEDELGFATAQYGSGAAAPFKAALSGAQDQLKQAFLLKQKLDDAEPDTEEQKRAWNGQIIQLCDRANKQLDDQAAAFDELRDLGKNAGPALEKVQREAAAAQARVQGASATLTELASQYSDAAIATVHDNPVQATERLAFVSSAIADAQAKLAANDSGHAAVGIRAAEEAADQAGLLLDAVDRLKRDLGTAASSIPPAIADLTGDVAQAKVYAAHGVDSAEAVAASTEQTISQVNAELAAPKPNPIAILARLQGANQQIDSVLGGVRDAEQQAQRARQSLEHTLLAAKSQVSAAQDFITARRGAVGTDARTRLAEAGRLVVQAEATAPTDPVTALAEAQRANQLAAEAISTAQSDVGGFSSPDGMGGLFGGGSSGGVGGGNGSMGAVLGGIVIGSLLNGGLGGGGGGMFGGGGGMFGGGGGFSSGSFGGGGTRSRRGGGRF